MQNKVLAIVVVVMGFMMPLCGMDELTGWAHARLSRAPELKPGQTIEYKYFNPEYNAKSGTTEYVQAGSVFSSDLRFTLKLPIIPDKQEKVPVVFALSEEEVHRIKSACVLKTRLVTKEQVPAALIWDIKKNCVRVDFLVTSKSETSNSVPRPFKESRDNSIIIE